MNPIAPAEATAYRERWPSWAHEAFRVAPTVNGSGICFVEVRCSLETGCTHGGAFEIDLRHDPPPSLLREMRAHMKKHGYVPRAERKPRDE